MESERTRTSDSDRLDLVYLGDIPEDVIDRSVDIFRQQGYGPRVDRVRALDDAEGADCVVAHAAGLPEDLGVGVGTETAVVLYPDGDGGWTVGGEVPLSDEYPGERFAVSIEGGLGGDQGDGYLELNSDWEFTYVSRRAGEILGREPEGILGENVWEEFPEAVGQSFYENYHTTMVEREPVSFEDFYDPLNTLFRVNAYPSGDGISVRFRAVAEDDDSDDPVRSRSADEEGVGLTLVSADEPYRIEYVSDGFTEITGRFEDEVTGESVDIIYSDETDGTAREEIRSAMEEERSTDVRLLSPRRDGTLFWNHVYVTPIYDRGELAYHLLSHRDVSEIEKRERQLRERSRYITGVKDAQHDLMEASSAEEVGGVLKRYSDDFFGASDVYIWREGSLRNLMGDGSVEPGEGDGVWEAFSGGETVESETEDGLGLDVPVGDSLVLSLGTDGMSGEKENFVSSITSSGEAALERIDREERLREMASELESSNEKLRRLSEIDTVVRDLVKRIVDLDSRSRIEEAVCESLLKVDGWDFVWITDVDGDDLRGRHDSGSGKGFASALEGVGPPAPAFEARDSEGATVVRDVALQEGSDWRRVTLDEGFLSVASVPLSHGPMDFGVLEVYSRETGAFDGDYSEALEDAAGVVGYSLASAERKAMVLSGGYNRVRLRLNTDDFGAGLARDLGRDVHVDAVASIPEGAVLYFDVEGVEEDDVRRVAESYRAAIETKEGGYEARVSDVGIARHAGEVGGRVSRYSPAGDDEGGDVEVVIDLPRDVDIRGFVDGLEDEYGDVGVVAKTSWSASPDSGGSGLPYEEFTEKQETALRTAYSNGFFEWPRETNGEEIAEMLGVSRPTFHRHIREAERRMVGGILGEGEGEDADEEEPEG